MLMSPAQRARREQATADRFCLIYLALLALVILSTLAVLVPLKNNQEKFSDYDKAGLVKLIDRL